MKRFPFFLLIALLWTCLPSTALVAQTPTTAPVKDIVVIDFFNRARVVPIPYVDGVRQQVIASFMHRHRQEILDAALSRSLSANVPGTGVVDPASAAPEQEAFLRSRIPAATLAGARFLVVGTIADYKFEHISLKDGKAGFRTTMPLLISAYDIKLGQTIPLQQYLLKGDAVIAEDADRAAVASLGSQMDYYINEYYKFETAILQLDTYTKKGVLKECYIRSGSTMGVELGDLFEIYEETLIGDVHTRKYIGRLRVNEVQDGQVSKCKVTHGADAIADAFNNGRPLIAVSAGKALFS
ncbi:MAG: hypothetical protein RR330_07640 [Alistipes sp.]